MEILCHIDTAVIMMAWPRTRNPITSRVTWGRF